MKWRPITNDNDILRDGDQFRLWQGDRTWSDWARVEVSIGLTLRAFCLLRAPREPWYGGEPSQMIEVRRPVTEGEHQ